MTTLAITLIAIGSIVMVFALANLSTVGIVCSAFAVVVGIGHLKKEMAGR